MKYLHSLKFKLNFYGSYLNRLKAPKQFRPILGQATAEGFHLNRLNAQNNLGSLKLKLHCPYLNGLENFQIKDLSKANPKLLCLSLEQAKS